MLKKYLLAAYSTLLHPQLENATCRGNKGPNRYEKGQTEGKRFYAIVKNNVTVYTNVFQFQIRVPL
jgi:hypothetical protein